MNPATHFKCDNCGGIFPRSDEETALAEMKENFGELPPSDQSIVCDDCYAKFMGWVRLKRIPKSDTTHTGEGS